MRTLSYSITPSAYPRLRIGWAVREWNDDAVAAREYLGNSESPYGRPGGHISEGARC